MSIRAIADAVGVTPPSIYLHFADRNQLVVAVCEEQFRQLDTAAQSALSGLDDPRARLVARGRAYIEFGLDNPEHYRVLMMTRPDGMPTGLGEGQSPGTSAFGHLVEDVQAAMARGQLRFGDAHLVASGVWMTVHGVTSLLIAKPGFPWPPVDQLIEHVLDVCIVGLSRASDPPPPATLP